MTIINSYLRESMGYKYLTKFATTYTFLAKYVLFGGKTISNEFKKKGSRATSLTEAKMSNFDPSYKQS